MYIIKQIHHFFHMNMVDKHIIILILQDMVQWLDSVIQQQYNKL